MTFQDNAWLRAEGCNVAKSVWRRNPWHSVHIISPVSQHLFYQSDADKRWVMELWPNWMFLLTLRTGHCNLTAAKTVRLIVGDFIEEGLSQVVTVAVLRHKMCFHIHFLIHISEDSLRKVYGNNFKSSKFHSIRVKVSLYVVSTFRALWYSCCVSSWSLADFELHFFFFILNTDLFDCQEMLTFC